MVKILALLMFGMLLMSTIALADVANEASSEIAIDSTVEASPSDSLGEVEVNVDTNTEADAEVPTDTNAELDSETDASADTEIDTDVSIDVEADVEGNVELDEDIDTQEVQDVPCVSATECAARETQATGTVELKIMPWYPKGSHYVFICKNDFNADKFTWHYGDGHKLIEIANMDTYHIFQTAGTYQVTCMAMSDTMKGESSMQITVTEEDLANNGRPSLTNPTPTPTAAPVPQLNTNQEGVNLDSMSREELQAMVEQLMLSCPAA